MTVIAMLLLYFAPPLAGILFGQQMTMFGRVWLFNVVYLLFWPIFVLAMPLRSK